MNESTSNGHSPDADTLSTPLTRRHFIQTTAAATAWSLTASSYARVFGANERLNVAFIGVGGIAGGQHIPQLQGFGAGCPCFCDVDTDRWGAAADRWSDARGFTDYRRMYDAHHRDIDAVMVGTPDHHHYPATIIAMMHGKHVYTQKPLTHTVWEARQLAIAQRKYGVATQMGNQGHALESLRVTIDYLRSGAIGDLREAHIWTNRPWWRQGLERPAGGQEVPANLDWDAWIGPAPRRPFRHDPADGWGGLYHPFNWRGFWDFGCGALGDMACHEVDPVYWAMNPGAPTSVELVDGSPFGDADMFAKASTVRFDFPAKNDRPGFKLFWYEGGRKPARPDGLEAETELTGEGAIYHGTKGSMIALQNARNAPRLLPADRHADFGAPPRAIDRSEGHHREWYDACVGNKPVDHPRCNFSYAAPFTESILLGCVVQRVGGRLAWNAEKLEFTNNAAATALVTKAYRSGWDFRL
ncbi:MAG: Gfo/Idh/MocA family protein [Planctomycetota bacterium]|jgi:predicted dehydrogenase